MSTAGTMAAGSANAANTDTAGNGAQAPAEARSARGAPTTGRDVFQPPLSAGGADSDLRRRAQRTQLATRVAAVGTIAAVAAVAALIAWRRVRR